MSKRNMTDQTRWGIDQVQTKNTGNRMHDRANMVIRAIAEIDNSLRVK